jgi:TolB-like protein/class 3 adenylate cyclase/Flp pilus assembly protein TadD
MADVERKLAAILSADVVGYSRLMAEDEAGTIRTLGAYRDEIRLLVDQHRGRVADFTGDNLLAEFGTALDAVECAAEVQRVLKARNAGLPQNRRMEFRIGVHLGDLAVEGERLYGDGVNIAARLEGLADPGGICISADVLHQVQRKLELDFDDLGERAVKNIPDPVHAYRVRERAVETPVRPRRGARRAVLVGGAAVLVAIAVAAAVYRTLVEPTPSGAPITSIAVLPFEDMSPEGDQKWLGDGMAEELIEALSRIEALRVIARTSAFALRGQDIETAGAKLKVGSVIEGSVRRSGDQLRVTAQLIRVADSSHLWSGTYARQLDDVFAIQREVAREVAEAIRTELGVENTWSWLIESRYATPDVRAWELLKRAGEREATWTEEGFRDEIKLTLQALDIDSEYAQAHAQLGWGTFYIWEWGLDPRDETLSKARASVERALELDPTNGSAHALLALLSMREGDWEGAETRCVRALKATASHSGIRIIHGLLLLATGRLEEAAPHLQRAAALDPEMASIRHWLGFLYLVEGNYEAAIGEIRRGLAYPLAPMNLAYAHHLNGDDERAAEARIDAAPSAEVGAAWRTAFAEDGYRGVVRAVLDYRISQSGKPCTDEPGRASVMLALIEEPDRMFECLNEGISVKRPNLFLKVSPAFDPYRSDPRFTALLRRMNLAD